MKLALVLVAGCASSELALSQAGDVVAETDRAWHPEAIEYLGEGCFAVDGQRIYECDTDHESLGAVSCIQELTDFNTYVTKWSYPMRERWASKRCIDRFNTKHPRPPEVHTCSMTVRDAESGLAIPTTSTDYVFTEMQRSGKDKVVATFDRCGPMLVKKSTGFPAIDQWLLGMVGGDACEHTVIVTLKDCVATF
ncbi:MAG: hypothetical protein QM831_15735 [Kofleriaceae bacterium]